MGPIRVLGTAYLRLSVVMPAVAGKHELRTVGKDLGLGVRASYPAHVTKIPELKARLQGQQYPGAETLAVKLIPLPVHHFVKNQDIQKELPRPSGRGRQQFCLDIASVDSEKGSVLPSVANDYPGDRIVRYNCAQQELC